ncbi:CREB-regulated transcription coactivator 1-like, partial [Limulus polyphemus]|uniref:CREB-regulated transcription coactivator 1-like n=1 Tax=Limulus polyphemus TaxID=6850 RepID=A0ABM1RXC5_LIMPO
IYPYQEESHLIHIPISNNTGSLPDLTNLHFPSPLATPLDVEDQSGLAYNQHSPSQSDIVTYSTLPPQQHHVHVIGPSVSGSTLIQTTAVVGGGGSRHNSPGPSPSPSSQRRHHLNSNNLVIGSSNMRHHGLHSSKQQQKGLAIDTNALSLNNYPPHQPSFGVYPQQRSNQSSQPHNNYVESQALPQIPVGSYHTNNTSDHSSSAPTSPVSQHFSPLNSPGLGPGSSLSRNSLTDTNYLLHHQQQQNQQANVIQQLQFGQYDTVGESLDQSDKFVM